jgi:uncharacterized FAD-dependent dehydrogenase
MEREVVAARVSCISIHEAPMKEILVDGGKVTSVFLQNRSRAEAQYVICGPGRLRAEWIKTEVERLGIPSVLQMKEERRH